MYGSDKWVVVPKPGEKGMHNHVLTVYAEGHRQMSRLSAASKQIVRDMTQAAAKPCAIWAAVQEKFPEDKATRLHIYNYRDKLRKGAFEHRDVIGQFYHLAVTYQYVHWMQTNLDTKVVTHLFMAHPPGVSLLRTYKWYIGMDSTFKTNKYKMPLFEMVGMTPCNKNFLVAYALMVNKTEASYTWVLQRLRVLIGVDDSPDVIVTDREMGLINPIAAVFLHSRHLLCTWHINKDVENKVYHLTGKNKQLGESFKNGKWRKIMEAATDGAYNAVVARMCTSWSHKPDVLQYVDRTWLVYKEMFVRRWTNDVFHLDNITNCRVESAHAELKQWLSSSTGSLDMLWAKVDKEIQAQLSTIRGQLEESRNRLHMAFSRFPFNYLAGCVSHYYLELLDGELKGMRDLSIQVYDRCGYVLSRTHGLSCVCELRGAVDTQTPISVRCIHEFWHTLIIRDDGGDIADYIDGPPEDVVYFGSLVDEVERSDPAVVCSISMLIHEEMHHEETELAEPEVKTTGKGRPRASTSTRCIPSSWEYSQRGRGRAPSSGSSRGCGYTSSSSVNKGSTADGQHGRDVHDFSYVHLINADILPYVESFIDVIGDDNCGYRVAADYCFGGEDQWRIARQCIANEVAMNRQLYHLVYYDGIDGACYRIIWDGGPCGPDHWMEVVEDLFPIATLFNVAFMYFGYGQGNRNGIHCMTVLPLRAPSSTTRPDREIVIGHLGDNYRHYIHLNLCRDFPVPSIVEMWYRHHTLSVGHWDQLYTVRRAQWDKNIST